MILYLDTSAIVKLYADEPGRAETRRLIAGAAQVASNLIAYVETRSALSRKHRMRQMNAREFDARKQEFNSDWAGFFVMPADVRLMRIAGDFTEQFGLRAYDAIHLASADQLRRETGALIRFACFDAALNAAAATLGLKAAES